MTKIRVNSLNELPCAAKIFISQIADNHIFAFFGQMGTGKTTFIKEICRQLGVNEEVTSPTFAIINEYLTNKGKSIYHFDCYRINNAKDAKEINFEDYFYSGSLCFIEWAENILDFLPDDFVRVNIQLIDNQARKISFN
jgi:tRNA threonylcarbamoyladenosine biosynthesis protein TsaE